MHQPIVIGPASDAWQPGFKQAKFGVIEFAGERFQHEHGENFFFQASAGEKFVGNLQQEGKAKFFENGPTEADCNFAKLAGVPASRLNFLFKEPLHFFRMRRGAAVFQHTAYVGCDVVGSDFAFGHFFQKLSVVSD